MVELWFVNWVTEYYTGTNYRPVKTVAKSSTTGTGLMLYKAYYFHGSTAIPALIIVAGILYTNSLADYMHSKFAVIAMLALTGMVVAWMLMDPSINGMLKLQK